MLQASTPSLQAADGIVSGDRVSPKKSSGKGVTYIDNIGRGKTKHKDSKPSGATGSKGGRK